jgi:hypothetical protein
MTHRHKGCLFCEIEKVIERSIKKGDYDLAKVLFVISQVFIGYTRHPNLSRTRVDQIAAAAKALTNLILAYPEDTKNDDNKRALYELAGLLGSLDGLIQMENGNLGGTIQ